ncbi:MAG: hypothetical protein DCC67_10370 [Planctomycetota bacterium]|nr:MAG: hypothetical protein DCC67_10370 [Planctomycetota bacterium]
MKRDLDLARQLLLDIENRGADCSVSVLRSGPNHDAEERIRYHLRLLIDAGLLKEVDRTASGVPCVRLTDAGHEIIELARNESRWRDAKLACQERTGGLSLAVVREILWQWAVDGPRLRTRRYVTAAPMASDGPYVGRRVAYRFEPYVETSLDEAPDEEVRYVRVRPAYRNAWRLDRIEGQRPLNGDHVDAVLPEHLI